MRHGQIQRLEHSPVCTGCAVTESFMWSTKYFYDEENVDAFRSEYEQMPIHRKVRENTVITAGLVLLMVSLLVGGGFILL